MSDQPVIPVPQICDKHQALLIGQAGYRPEDTWRALIIVANIALFQAMTCDDKVREITKGDVTKLSEFGCFACYKPDRFGEIVAAIGRSKDIGRIKALGERWVNESANVTTN